MRKFWSVVLLGGLVISLLVPGQWVQGQEVISGNLLVNGDFEDGDLETGWPLQDGIPEVQVAPGWRGFFLDTPPGYVSMPVACEGKDQGCYWARPEFRDIKAYDYAYRVYSGQRAQKYFTFGRQHEAGLMQTVSGITPGTALHFQAFVMLWSCTASGGWNNCPTKPNSNAPAWMHARVGLDPTGGRNPWAATVIWSGESNTVDTWLQLQVDAVAQAEQVTVFVYTRADWHDLIPRINNDVYIDNASLVMLDSMPAPIQEPVTEPTAAPTEEPDQAPTPTAILETGVVTPTATPEDTAPNVAENAEATPTPVVPTATPAPPTPTVDLGPAYYKMHVDVFGVPREIGFHVVQPGETLGHVALAHDMTIEHLRRLNADRLRPDDIVWVGDRLIIVTYVAQ